MPQKEFYLRCKDCIHVTRGILEWHNSLFGITVNHESDLIKKAINHHNKNRFSQHGSHVLFENKTLALQPPRISFSLTSLPNVIFRNTSGYLTVSGQGNIAVYIKRRFRNS